MNTEKQVQKALNLLSQTYGIAPQRLLSLLEEEQQIYSIPVSLFTTLPLSSLEAITVYLREVKKLPFPAMEKIVGRSRVTLRVTYRNARKKYAQSFSVPESQYKIPCHVLKNKQLSVLENIAFHLKSRYQLLNHEIAKLLNKDPRTIWTVLHRIQLKERTK